MASDPINFTTGPAIVPDIGRLSYNYCTFSPLFATSVSGEVVEDDSKRTTKITKVTLTVDGYVTLSDGMDDISPTMDTLHTLLTARGGALRYEGRGFNIVVGNGQAANKDLAWGPVPKMLDFQPMGGGLSAKVKWQVVVHISAANAGRGLTSTWRSKVSLQPDEIRTLNVLQFNFESSVNYAEDGFSTISMSGVLEIPLTRPAQTVRTLEYTADDVRPIIEENAIRSIDLSRFRITQRKFDMLRDKRTITWSVTAEEKPYMDLPPNCTIARGTYDVKPARSGPGLCLWVCSLKATYTLRADVPRRQAYELFLALMQLRMAHAARGNITGTRERPRQQDTLDVVRRGVDLAVDRTLSIITQGGWDAIQLVNTVTRTATGISRAAGNRAILIDFSISEGLYLDSKTVTFSAAWRIVTTLSHILVASGLWTKVNERTASGGNLWATTVRDISGASSWLTNRTDPALSVIVDFGS